MERREKRTHITQDRVLQELSRIAFFDIRRIYDEKGLLKRPEDLDADSAAALAGIDVVEQAAFEMKEGDLVSMPLYTKRVKIFDKNAALTLAMRHLGMLRDKIEHTGADGGPIKTVYLNNTPVEELPE
jgi:phage terminase small subunit